MKVKVTTGVSRIAFAVPDFIPLTVAVQQTAPTVTSAASISGTTAPTGLLTLTEGTASGNPAPTGSIQWYLDGSALSGETAATIDKSAHGVGAYHAVVTWANGVAPAATSQSNTITVAVQQTAPTVTSAASISGTTAPTGLLTLTEGTASGNPAPTGSIQWYLDGSALSGETAATIDKSAHGVGAYHAVVTWANGVAPAATSQSNTITVAVQQTAPSITSAAAWPEPGRTLTITAGSADTTVTVNGVDVLTVPAGQSLEYAPTNPGTLVATNNIGSASITIRPLLANLAGVTVAINTDTPYAGTASNVTSITAGGSRTLSLGQMDAANAVKILKTATGFRFQGGNWLRGNGASITAGKVLFVAKFFAHSHTGTDGRFVDTSLLDLLIQAGNLRISGALSGNFNINMSAIAPFGAEQTIAILSDLDTGTVTFWERDGYEVVTTRTAGSGAMTQFDFGRFADAELREFVAFEVGPGQALPISGFDAWKQMAQINLTPPVNAEVMGGLGQSLWQSWPVPASPPIERSTRNLQAREHALAVEGIRRASDGGLLNEIGNGGNAYDYTITAEQVTLRPLSVNNGETILFAMTRWLRDYRAAAGLPTPALIAGTNGLGGQGIDEFDDDPTTGTTKTTLLENNEYWFTTAYNRGAIEYGSADIRYFGVVHGTADKTASLGEYYTDFIRAVDLHLDHCETLSGTSPKLWMTQSGGDADSSNGDVWAVCLDQLELVDHYNAVFVGPLYPYKIADDNVHPDHNARTLVGELAAIKIVQHELGNNLNAKSASSVVWASDHLSVVLTYASPTGCTAIGPHDENKYDAYGGFMSDYGFDSDTTITGVSFNGNQITVTFATAPAWLSYAMQVQDIQGHTDGTGHSYTAHRGVLAWDWEQASLFDHSYTHRLWLPTDMWVPK